MASQDLVRQLLGLPDVEAQRRFLAEHAPQLNDDVAHALKDKVDHLMRADVNHSLQIADLLLYLGELTGNPGHRALGLLAEANTRSLGLGQYRRALNIYNEAADIYQNQGDLVEQARSQVGKIWPLACLGYYAEAFTIGEWASQILESHAQWHSLATLTMNLAITYGRQGDDTKALAMFDKAQSIYEQLGPDAELSWALAEQNRSIVLRNLGRFQESIQASQKAWQIQQQLGYPVQAARAQQNLGMTYFVLGRYNEALERLDEARDTFLADGRRRDAVLADLFISDCLLQLRRFQDVLEKCRQVRGLFTKLGTRFEVGQAILNEATAYAGLQDEAQALASLAEAQQLFEQEGNQVWAATTALETAAVLYLQGQFQESLTTAQACAITFQTNHLPVKEAQAHLAAGRAAAALNLSQQAYQLIAAALAIGEAKDIPTLSYHSYQLQGVLSESQGDLQGALHAYERAVGELERLRGRLMIEFRAAFLEDKGSAYENTVRLCLDMERLAKGLEYVERAKSRSLIDLIAHRLDLGVQVRSADDQPLVAELMELRRKRDQLYRRWDAEDGPRLRGNAYGAEAEPTLTRGDVLALEKQITEVWHKLLIRNADYARDAALCQVRTEPIQDYLDDDTLLIEYFAIDQQFVVFLVSTGMIEAIRLPADLVQVQRLLQSLQLNLKVVAVSQNVPDRITRLVPQAIGVLARLYQLLVAPFSGWLTRYRRLIIVPHGPLHYLPFHALHDGDSFLLARHEVSYLPSGSFLRYCHETLVADSGTLVLGNSVEGRLPNVLHEARTIAARWGTQPLLEKEATREQVQRAAPNCRILHLASHGDFRADNPLFSGLMLADGWLTTLDVFNLHLKASLVTLSACQTGRAVIGGGDELLGLMRAFLSAGASALVLSHWAVEDHSTAQLMETFYQKLEAGWTKGAALRYAQLQLAQPKGAIGGNGADIYSHPFFWAPFFLVGNAGPL
jgi:CHAT domain-containing protein